MQDDLTGLTVLLAVADKRSFTAAAAALRITPSAVSQTVRALEARVGVQLLQRSTRSVSLTEAGARFVARLQPAMAAVRDALDSLGELRDRPAGTLRLTLPRLGHEQVLAPRLPAFLAAYPDIRLDLRIDEGFTDIVAAGLDAGLRIGERVEREMVGVRVSDDLRMAVVAAPSYLARRAAPRHPRELHAHDCINYRGRSQGIIARWEFTEDGTDFELAVDGRLVIDDGDLMVRAAIDGLGIVYIPDCAVREPLADGRLVRLLDTFCTPFPGFFLYYPSRARIAPKLQALIDFLRWKPRPGDRPRP